MDDASSLLSFLSSMDPLCSADELEMVSGLARGSRLVRVRNGPLAFDILPDRGMNLGNLDYRGLPLAWLSSVGYAAPAFSAGAIVPAGKGSYTTEPPPNIAAISPETTAIAAGPPPL